MRGASFTNKVSVLKTFGQSMAPSLLDGDILFLRKISFGKIKSNDVISIKKDSRFLAHRVIYKAKRYLITRGDNNKISDRKIYPRKVVGIVYQLKRNGHIVNPQSLYLFQSTFYFEEIVKIKKELEKQRVDFLFLKGLPLHLYFEKTHPKRLYSDCDILVDKKDLGKVSRTLIRLGYKTRDTSFSNVQHTLKDKQVEISFSKIFNGLPVIFDVHTEIVFMMTQLGSLDALYPQRLIERLTKDSLETKKQIKINNEKFSILNSELLILYLALHFFHHNFRGAFRLEFLDKIIAKVHLQDAQWNLLGQKIVDYKLQNFVYPVFVLLKKYYKTHVPVGFLKSIRPSRFHHPSSIFDDESRINAGIYRFKSLLYLSPFPFWRKALVFLNPQVIYSIFWVVRRRLSSFFLNRRETRLHL